MTRNGLRGVIAAVPTPVTASGDPDTARFLRHAQWALDNGCDALNVLGTTGEANSFGPEQRTTLMEAAAGALDTTRLMVGTGTPDLKTTIALTRRAHELGFAAALVLPPYYYKGVSDEGLFAWFERLISGTSGTPIPVYLYNFPQMTGLTFSPALARRLKEAFPDRITGAKDSSGDLDYASELAKISDFAVFPSNEASISKAESENYAGCISATASVTAPLVAKLWAEPTNDDALEAASSARTAISAHPLIPAVKYLTARLHDDADFATPLPPHMPLTDEQKTALDEIPL
ncbi:dihydrodipicolinate synthase family protein [Nitratireductor sp. B36]|uniref:dihydrodipicolinate synthase family protein n=1 Tax=Nitratireductor sp. B36 TaxID=2762059 RepID=UPI001E2EE5A2|nr:dihydrodipicolinate synthase family protein [Nitratireductor sp. B36]MCC5779256.1 dihydrodipicolinate synthase family protein [Nitratireductor sp. B36]